MSQQPGDDDDDLRCILEDECDDWIEDAEVVPPPALAPAHPVKANGVLAATYNRIGGALEQVASVYGVDVACALAVWKTESGPTVHAPGHAVIRFENHRLWKLWGRAHNDAFVAHFQFGDPIWKGHEFRANEDSEWMLSHTAGPSGQRVEYAALAKAIELAGEDIALRCISIGGPQILCSNFALLGYASPAEMYADFQRTEDVHVRGFFKFCEAKKIIGAMKSKDWAAFARVYNGPGQVDAYGAKIAAAYAEARTMLSKAVIA